VTQKRCCCLLARATLLSPASKPRKSKTEKRVPTYAADGRRLRDYVPSAVEHLFKLSLVVVRRNKSGRVVLAQFRGVGGANPLRATALAGTRYSFIERLHESRCWSHRRLLPREAVENLLGKPVEDAVTLDRYLRAIFRAVPLSVMK
jgi:hypothetical protein